VTISRLTPERFTAAEIGIDLLKPATFDHLGDSHRGRSAG
jgi:hypothetical protein